MLQIKRETGRSIRVRENPFVDQVGNYVEIHQREDSRRKRKSGTPSEECRLEGEKINLVKHDLLTPEERKVSASTGRKKSYGGF